MNTTTTKKQDNRTRTLAVVERNIEALEIERALIIGRKDLAAGRTIPHEMVMKMMQARLGIK